MERQECIELAKVLNVYPQDVAAFYWGSGSEEEAGFEEEGNFIACERAIEDTFGTQFFHLIQDLESLPGMFDHVIYYVMTGKKMKAGGGRSLDIINSDGMALIKTARELYMRMNS